MKKLLKMKHFNDEKLLKMKHFINEFLKIVRIYFFKKVQSISDDQKLNNFHFSSNLKMPQKNHIKN